MKPFTSNNLTQWVESVDSSFEVRSSKSQEDKQEYKQRVIEYLDGLYSSLVNFKNQIAIMQPSDLPNTEISDSLVIVFKADLEELGNTRRSRRRGTTKKTYRTPKKALYLNIYPENSDDNTIPFLLATTLDERMGSISRDDSLVPLSLPLRDWGFTLKSIWKNKASVGESFREYMDIPWGLSKRRNSITLNIIENAPLPFSKLVDQFFTRIGITVEPPTLEDKAERKRLNEQQKRDRQFRKKLEERARTFGMTLTEVIQFDTELEDLSSRDQRRREKEELGKKYKRDLIKQYGREIVEFSGNKFGDPENILDELIRLRMSKLGLNESDALKKIISQLEKLKQYRKSNPRKKNLSKVLLVGALGFGIARMRKR